jgi:hypothetical protein
MDLTNADDVWNAWRGFGTAVVNLNSTGYLSVETRLPDLQVGDLPTLIQPARSLGRGWAYAIVTKDPRRQAAAARLLQQLLSPQSSGAWTAPRACCQAAPLLWCNGIRPTLTLHW